MNIDEVMKKGITKIRLTKWANPDAYIELKRLPNGGYGYWTELHDELGKKALGDDEFEKVKIATLTELKEDDWIEYIPTKTGN